eukprot:413483_1
MSTKIIFIWLYSLLIFISNAYSVICESHGACKNETIQCPPDEDCFLQCSGAEACSGVNITCPLNYECNILCYNAPGMDVYKNILTCSRMVINAKQSSVFRLNANIGDIDLFDDSLHTVEEVTIYCPQHGTNPSCQITCNGDNIIHESQIYVVAGLSDLNITSKFYHDKSCLSKTSVHCTNDFSHHCLMTNVPPLQCEAIENIKKKNLIYKYDTLCETLTLSPTYPTINPIPSPSTSTNPTSYPTHTPAIDSVSSDLLESSDSSNDDNPTFSPTITPTFSPTINPTLSPTINPTQLPTNINNSSFHHITTFSPIINPTLSPTLSPTNINDSSSFQHITTFSPPTNLNANQSNKPNIPILLTIAISGIIITFICGIFLCCYFFITSNKKNKKTFHERTSSNSEQTYMSVSDEQHSDTYENIDTDSRSSLYKQSQFSTEMFNESETEFVQSEFDDREEKISSSSFEQDTISIPTKIFANNHEKGLHRWSKKKK